MRARARLHLHRDLESSWVPFAYVLERASYGHGDAAVIDGHGRSVAELQGGQRFTARLQAGLTPPAAVLATPRCDCPRRGQRSGCLEVARAVDGAVVLSGRCPQVVARALVAVLVAQPRAIYLELADPGVLPARYRGSWTLPPPPDPSAMLNLAELTSQQIRELVRAARADEGRGGFWVGGHRCVDCNRELSDMVSIERGRGEICEGRHRRRRSRAV